MLGTSVASDHPIGAVRSTRVLWIGDAVSQPRVMTSEYRGWKHAWDFCLCELCHTQLALELVRGTFE